MIDLNMETNKKWMPIGQRVETCSEDFIALKQSNFTQVMQAVNSGKLSNADIVRVEDVHYGD